LFFKLSAVRRYQVRLTSILRNAPMRWLLLLSWSFSALSAAEVSPKSLNIDSRKPGDAIYIVQLDAPPVALFRGEAVPSLRKFGPLSATSPEVLGARKIEIASKRVVDYRAALASSRADWLRRASATLGRKLEAEQVMDLALNALTLRLSEEEARQLESLNGVHAIEPSRPTESLADASAEWMRAPPVWEAPEPIGTFGEGMVLGLIDSGINARHQAFAGISPEGGYVHVNPRPGLFGLCRTTPSMCNGKLIGVYDFGGCPADNPGCGSRPLNGGSDSDGPHGSQVASIAVGNFWSSPLPPSVRNLSPQTRPIRLSGIAPRASLVSYRTGQTTAGVIASINQAVADGVDVMNLSLVTVGGTEDPWTSGVGRALLGARAAGILVAVSGGNNSSAPGFIAGVSPWTTAVASSSHHRLISQRLVGLAGGAGAPPSGGVLHGIPCRHLGTDELSCSAFQDGTQVLEFAPIAANTRCAATNGAPSPFTPGALSGKLAVCELDASDLFFASVQNAVTAGASGVVVIDRVSTNGPGNVTWSRVPGIVLNPQQGDALLAWLRTGEGHRAAIEPLATHRDPSRGDVLSSFSSYGPAALGALLKPDITAPGEQIFAAGAGLAPMVNFSGTSASAPQVAGAMLLVRAARPDWNVDAVESALLGTASPTVRSRDGSRLAHAFEQGSGRVDVQKAVHAGLSFPQPIAAFEQANPQQGGDLTALNRPSIVSLDCSDGCVFVRRVKDLVGGGRWRVEVDAPDDFRIEVSPSEFDLSAGGEQALSVRAAPASVASIGNWLEGAIRLVPISPEVSVTRVPVRVLHAAGGLPAELSLELSSARGYLDVQFDDVSKLRDLRVAAVEPTEPVRWSDRVAQHPSPRQVLPRASTGSKLFWLDVDPPADGTGLLVNAKLTSQTARDLDLYVGVDSRGDGQLRPADVRCEGMSTSSTEDCRFELSHSARPQRVWLLVHAFAAGPSGEDAFELFASALRRQTSNAPALRASAPMKVENGRFSVRLAWDLPQLIRGSEMLSELHLAVGAQAPFARIPVMLKPAPVMRHAPQMLAPGAAVRIAIPGSGSHPGLVVDVPDNARALTATLEGAADLEFRAAPAPDFEGPVLPVLASETTTSAASFAVSGGRRIRIEGASLRPGRWYLHARNPGAQAALARVSVEVEADASAPAFVSGAYYNPQRSGSGVYLYDAGDQRSLLWYAYLQDGTPTWYLGVAPKPAANIGTWRVPLLRFGWNGSAAVPTEVGEAVVTLIEGESVRFSWNLDGESGSETYRRIGAGACPSGGLDLNGTWYPPQRSGIGFSITAGTGIESQAVYLYDDRGIARWLAGSTAPFGAERIPLLALSGSCPLCDYRAPQATAAGELRRSYLANGREGRIGLSVTLPTAIAGSWDLDLPVQKLTSPVGCAASR
jgi:hypothetical protein